MAKIKSSKDLDNLMIRDAAEQDTNTCFHFSNQSV